MDHLESANLRVVDSTVPGFRISEAVVDELASELTEKVSDLDPNNFVVVIQLLDNSVYECKLPNGDRVLPCMSTDRKYHAIGELSVIGKDTLRDHFLALQPIFRAVCGFKTPLPRYIWNRFCDDTTHLTNSEKPSFASDMGRELKELTISLRNMVFMPKLEGVMILNSVETLGLVPGENGEALDIDRALAL